MATQIRPAASLRDIPRLPAARVRIWASNHLMWMALWSIGRAIFRVEENVLPALREGRADTQPQNGLSPGTDDITEMRSTGRGEACYGLISVPAVTHAAGRREEDRGILSR